MSPTRRAADVRGRGTGPAEGGTRGESGALPDIAGPGLLAVFVGINPGLRSALIGHHFAGYSNRFWKLLFDARLTPERLTAEEDYRLPDFGLGVTNLVSRATAGIGELSLDDYRAGRRRLTAKLSRWRPGVVALVGVTLYRALLPAGSERDAPAGSSDRSGANMVWPLGLHSDRLAGISVFVLPNPSGRNANYSYGRMLEAFVALERHLRDRGSGAAALS